MKQMMKKLWHALREDLKTENSDFKLIVIKCLIIGFLVLISLWIYFFSWLALAAILIFSITQWNGRAAYYNIFLFPISNIFRIHGANTLLQPLAFALIVIVIGVIFFVQVITKKKKIPWVMTGLCLIASIFFLMRLDTGGGEIAGGLIVGLWFVYLCWMFQKDITFKEMSLILFLGIFLSFFIGFLSEFSATLQSYIDIFSNRYSGAFANPNHLAIYAVLGMSCFYFLFLNKEINFLFYPIFAFFYLCSLVSLSKAALILNALLFVMFLLISLVKYKKKVFPIIAYCFSIAFVCSLCCYKQSQLLINRIIGPILRLFIYGGSGVGANEESFINDFTSDRSIIWKRFTDSIFSSFNNVVFGQGPSVNIGDAHNWYLKFWFHYGIIGFILLASIAFVIIRMRKGKFNWPSLICVTALFGYMFAETIFKTFLGLGVVLLLSALFSKNIEIIETEEGKSTCGKNLIPKIIHYVWLGGNPQPKKIQMCIASWKRIMPDYQIKLWDESNVNLDEYEFLRDAYDAKKFGFTVDPLRLHILKQEGGIYLDADVEVLKPLDEFLCHQAFSGLEVPGVVAPGLILAATKDCKFLDDMIKIYKKAKFSKDDCHKNITGPGALTTYLKERGLNDKDEFQIVEELAIYPSEYFCPKSLMTNKFVITDNTYLVHHYASSWISTSKKIKKTVKYILNFFTNGWFGVFAIKIRNWKQRRSVKCA